MADTSGKVRLRMAASRMGGRRRAAARPAPPWRAWVETLLGRYLRRTARPGGPERVLARPLSFVRERWLFASRTLLPQIRLAIQPVLRPRLWQAGPVLATPRQDADLRIERTLVERTLGGRPLPEAAFTPAPAVLARLRAPASAGAVPPAALAVAGPPAGRPPLQLVFQRLREPQRALGAASAARREEGLAARPALSRRLAEKSRRVEQAPAAVPARVVARREAPAASTSPEPPAAAWASRTAQARWHGPASGPSAAPQPAVNVAVLADQVMRQIDDRLHAWQERTGF